MNFRKKGTHKNRLLIRQQFSSALSTVVILLGELSWEGLWICHGFGMFTTTKEIRQVSSKKSTG